MSQKTYMYDTQWTALINAIQGGDPTAIVTALGDIKDSIDAIETALGSLSTDVTQDATQWTNLINAISSGGGGGGGNVTIDSTQWTNLLTSIDKGDTSALATALGLIKSSIDSINTSLGSLNVGVSQNATQWTNLVNAITNQSITVDLSNITSDVVSNESTVTPADTVTDALDVLKSDLTIDSASSTNVISVNGTYQIPSNVWAHEFIMLSLRRQGKGNSTMFNKADLGQFDNGVGIFVSPSEYYKVKVSSTGLITLLNSTGLNEPFVLVWGLF